MSIILKSKGGGERERAVVAAAIKTTIKSRDIHTEKNVTSLLKNLDDEK